MNKTLKRALSGTVYVAIMWFGTSYYQESFHALFLILGIICLYEIWKLRKGKSIFTSSEIIPYLYVITPFTLVHFISPVFMLFLFILTWAFDTFAYLVGSKFGKHKILPSVSPKKSWEGFVGGFIFTIIISYFTYKHFDFLKFPLIISIILPFTATIGDFIESYYKRKAGVKDSGNFIPGHGGMLDRMDAFMISIPVFYLLINLYK